MAQSIDLSSNRKKCIGKDIVTANREFILTQKDKGVSLERIAEQLGISTSTLHRYVVRWKLPRAEIHFRSRGGKLQPTPVSPEIKRLAISQAWN